MAANQNISNLLFEIVRSTVTAYFSYFLFVFVVVFNSESAAPPEPKGRFLRQRAGFISLSPGTGIGSVP